MSSKSRSPPVTVPARPNHNLALSINARTAAAPVACSNLVAAVVVAVRKARTRGRAVVAAKNSTSDPANAVAAAVVAMLETVAMAAAVFRRNRSNPIH